MQPLRSFKEFNAVPEIATERMVMRELVSGDAKELFSIFSDRETMHFYEARVHRKIDDTRKMIKRFAKNLKKQKAIQWCITLKDASDVIGLMGYHRWHVEHGRAEANLILSKHYWNRKFFQESFNALVHAGFERMGLNRIEGILIAEHVRVQHVLTKYGFVQEGVLREYKRIGDRLYDCYMMSMLYKDFKALKDKDTI